MTSIAPTASSAAANDPCFHCAEPIPRAHRVEATIDDTGPTRAFCCHGCLAAAQIIVGAGLGSFYTQRQWTEVGIPAGVFEETFDDAHLLDAVEQTGDGAELTVLVEGIRCASCIWVLERLLSRLDGVDSARVSFATHRLTLRFDPTRHSPGELLGRVAAVGYRPRALTRDAADRATDRERRATLLRLGLAAFLSMQLMAYSVGLYAGYFVGMAPPMRELLQWLAGAVATPVVFYSGWPFWRGALRAVTHRVPDMDLLVAIGVGTAWGYSVWALWAGREVYFDSAAMIVTLLLVGRMFELSARRRASAGIERLLHLTPEIAHRLGDATDVVEDVPTDQLVVGDVVVVRPGERFVADGHILEGTTEVVEAPVSGEPEPVSRGPEDTVRSGTINLTVAVRVRLTHTARDSFVGRVAALVRDAEARRPPIQRLADRVAGGFVPVVLAAAGLTAAGWLVMGYGSETALLHAISVLVVACPCALGLATPTAIVVAAGTAAREGIFLRGGDILEALARVRVVAFDKTGTLTEGRPRVIAIHGDAEDEVLLAAARVEAGSNHPIARAILNAAAARGLDDVGSGAGVEVEPGRGARSVPEGIVVGNAAFVRETGAEPGELTAVQSHHTLVHVARGDRYLGAIALADEPRHEARAAVSALRSLGLRGILLTGDRASAAERIARTLDLDVVDAELSPADKVERIRDQQRGGDPVLMVGDGINDAAALAEAAVGCAMAGSTDVALETSDVVLAHADLLRLPRIIELARRTLGIVRQNLAWAFAYNAVTLPLAMSGNLAPIWAAAAMATSSVLVVTNSLRLSRTRH